MGGKEPSSTSRTLWPYWCPLKTLEKGWYSCWEIAGTVKVKYSDIDERVSATRWSTSLSPGCRGDPHRGCVQSAIMVMPTTRSSVAGVWGSTWSTSGQTSRKQSAVKSRISLCLWIGNPPILHATARHIVWSTEKAPPHARRSGRCCSCQPYRSASASRNASFAKQIMVIYRNGSEPRWRAFLLQEVKSARTDVPRIPLSLQLLLLADGRLCTLRLGGSWKCPVTLLHAIFIRLSQGSCLQLRCLVLKRTRGHRIADS